MCCTDGSNSSTICSAVQAATAAQYAVHFNQHLRSTIIISSTKSSSRNNSNRNRNKTFTEYALNMQAHNSSSGRRTATVAATIPVH